MRFLLTILVFCLLATAPVAAQDFNIEQLLQIAQKDGMSLSEAVESVRAKTDGRIISAETKRKNGAEVHHIKVLTKDGKVKTHKIKGRKSGNG